MSTRPLADLVNGACANPRLITGGDPTNIKQSRELAARLREKLRHARRYYIDEEVTRAATRLGVQHPKILMEMLYRARTPFDKIWIEWPVEPQVEEAGGVYEDDAPERTGCFVEQLSDEEPLYRLSFIGAPGRNERTHEISLCHVAVLYHLKTPIFEARNLNVGDFRIDQPPKSWVRRTLVGSAYLGQNDQDADDEEMREREDFCDQLTAHAAWISEPMLAGYHREIRQGKHDDRQYVFRTPGITGRREARRDTASPKEALGQMMINGIQEGGGTWRFVLSVLALINAQNMIQQEGFRHSKARSQIIGGHVVPYLEHVLLKLKLPRQVVEQKMVREMTEAIPRRRHEVSGSWREWHHRGDPNCEHAYIDVTPTRQRCPLCGHAQWWVPKYERGDSRVGWVTKDRLVTRR